MFYVEDLGHDICMASSPLTEDFFFAMYGFQNVLPRRDDFFFFSPGFLIVSHNHIIPSISV